MGYHNVTKIQREEAYVKSHAASVERTIHSKEFKLGTVSYVETGHIPHDHFWNALAKQEARNPAKFFAHNPQYVGFFTAPAILGELPHNNVLFDVMKSRDVLHHSTFVAYHRFYVGMVERDLQLESQVTTTPTIATTPIATITPTPAISTLAGATLLPPSSLSSPGASQTGSTGMGQPSPAADSSAGVVPEPASILLMILGLVAVGAVRCLHPALRARRASVA